jgi:ferredoxin
VNACRVCVVEVEGARVLAPACARKAEAGMKVKTDTERVRHSRKLVLEFLASSVDLSTASGKTHEWIEKYEADPKRFGADASRPAAPEDLDHHRDHHEPGHHDAPNVKKAATVAQPVKHRQRPVRARLREVRALLQVRRGLRRRRTRTPSRSPSPAAASTRASRPSSTSAPDSACVYCGNCIAVCPTGALMAKDEFDLRAAGKWDERRRRRDDTICPYCGVGCDAALHVQDDAIVKVTSPARQPVTLGNLCIKGPLRLPYITGVGMTLLSSQLGKFTGAPVAGDQFFTRAWSFAQGSAGCSPSPWRCPARASRCSSRCAGGPRSSPARSSW